MPVSSFSSLAPTAEHTCHFSAFELALKALAAERVDEKLAAVDALAESLHPEGTDTAVSPTPTLDAAATNTLKDFVVHPSPAPPVRGRLSGLTVVAPKAVPQRKLSAPDGRAALLHAIAHIEYCAIDLALDHALRFERQPLDYYADWLGVALEEAYHFRLVRQHLLSLAWDYGDFPVHDSLWRMAERTAHDVLHRMAMVPRLFEARGLDATPPIQEKLAAVGDHEAVAILDVILRDEVGHVGLGDKWFRWMCNARSLEPESTYRRLMSDYSAPWPQTPINRAARLSAGFGERELDDLTSRRAAE
jgi:uncharacterized ferritin-like protein (DUF455 family)